MGAAPVRPRLRMKLSSAVGDTPVIFRDRRLRDAQAEQLPDLVLPARAPRRRAGAGRRAGAPPSPRSRAGRHDAGADAGGGSGGRLADRRQERPRNRGQLHTANARPRLIVARTARWKGGLPAQQPSGRRSATAGTCASSRPPAARYALDGFTGVAPIVFGPRTDAAGLTGRTWRTTGHHCDEGAARARHRCLTCRPSAGALARWPPARAAEAGYAISFSFLSGRIFTEVLAGLAFTSIVSPGRNGFGTFFRALCAGFCTTLIFIRPGIVHAPTAPFWT